MLVRLLAATADGEQTIVFTRFAYETLVDRALAEICWAHRGLAPLDDLG